MLGTSNPKVLHEGAEIDLSKEEDNVTSIAVGKKRGKNLLVYAGINSSPKDVAKGKNEHFRTFGLESQGGSEKASISKISPVSKSKLFNGDDRDVYQRVLRLSRPYAKYDQLGVIATGLATKESEIVLFDTISTKSTEPALRGRIELNQEAADVDAIQTGKDEYSVAYCMKNEILLKTVSATADEEAPISLYTTLVADHNGPVTPLSFRALRFMSSEFLIVLANLPAGGGCRLQIYRIFEKDGVLAARVAQTRQLPSKVKQGTGLAVVNLRPTATPGERQGYSQFIVAVSGQDSSICLFVVDLQVATTISLMMQPKPLAVIKQAHPLGITGLAFSTFIPPTSVDETNTPTVKLASVSVGNTVVVYTIPLKLKDKSSGRYITAVPPTNEGSLFTPLLAISLLTVLVVSIIVQGFLEIQGTSKPYLGAKDFIDSWDSERFSYLTNSKPFAFKKRLEQSTMRRKSALVDRVEKLSAETDDDQFVVIHDSTGEGDIKAVKHDEAKHGPPTGKTWDELPPEQKAHWKKKLMDGGHWVEGFGETILKGVLFGEMGAAVGQAVAGI